MYFVYIYIQSDLYYPRYLGILNFGFKTADNRGVDNRGLKVLHISWAYQILASKTADNRGLTGWQAHRGDQMHRKNSPT